MKINILHIAVHLGGGVGTVVKNWIENDPDNNHTVLLLNENYYGNDPSYIHSQMRGKDDEIREWIEKSDIVIVHFWNHPYLFEFIVNFKFPPCRLCIWSHVSGLNPPYVISEKLIGFSDKFVLSSPISLEGDIKHFSKSLLDKTSTIWTTGGVYDYLKIDKGSDSKDFVIGYIGTLDYSKMSPDFIYLCEEILKEIPTAKFVICGVGSDEEKMKEEVLVRGLNNSFDFKGMCLNIKEVITSFSVFGYPLNEKHFGTCEQVLGEAMAVGVMPVVLDNPAEKYIVVNVGRVSKGNEEYVANIVNLYNNAIDDEAILSLKERAEKLYSMDTMINSWNKLFSEVLMFDKKEREWNKNKDVYDGYDIFLESIGKYADIIEYGDLDKIKRFFLSNSQFFSKSKGSVNQYVDAFPLDERLLEIVDLVNNAGSFNLNGANKYKA